jgi:hypothetical protein
VVLYKAQALSQGAKFKIIQIHRTAPLVVLP